jgi:ribosomal protein S18 acetylase RimI-like enzyme
MGSDGSAVDQIEHIEFKMVRRDLNDIPPVTLPEGYHIRSFRDGDIANWCRIETSVDEFSTIERAERYFDREFGPQIELMGDRSFMLETSDGVAIGTTTAWFGTLDGELMGKIHWVAIDPAYQGRGLAKPLLATALHRLVRDHQRAFLETQTTSYRAVGLYLKYGFEPVLESETDRRAWAIVEDLLGER